MIEATTGESAPVELQTPAWRWRFLRNSVPGALRLAGGRLSFVGVRPKDGFDAALSDIHSLAFTAGDTNLKLKIQGKRYRVVFIKPLDARPAPAELANIVGFEALGAQGLIGTLRTYPGGMKSGGVWRRALLGDPHPQL